MEFRGTRKASHSENRREEKQNSSHCGSQLSPQIPASNRTPGPTPLLSQKADRDLQILASVAGCPGPWHRSLLQALEFPAPVCLPRYNFDKNREPLQETPAVLRKPDRVARLSVDSWDPCDAHQIRPQITWTESRTPQVGRTAPANTLRPALLVLHRIAFWHSMLGRKRCGNPAGRWRGFLSVVQGWKPSRCRRNPHRASK